MKYVTTLALCALLAACGGGDEEEPEGLQPTAEQWEFIQRKCVAHDGVLFYNLAERRDREGNMVVVVSRVACNDGTHSSY